ncbi:MAG: NAD(P)-binding protein, partial [Bacteroidota bacterium]
VVGAGAAGLYTAWHLNALGFDVTILEASDHIGGRIRPLTDFADFDIELGAEEIHGNNSKWYDIVQQTGATLLNQQTEDYFSFKQALGNPNEPNLKSEAQANQYNDFLNTVAFVENAGSYSGIDQSVDSAFKTSGISWNLLPMSNAMLGNEYGTSDSRLSIRGLAEEDDFWTAGDESYGLKDKSFLWVLETKFAPILDKVKKALQVKIIDFQNDKVKLKAQA